jgi:hypothetical protein
MDSKPDLDAKTPSGKKLQLWEVRQHASEEEKAAWTAKQRRNPQERFEDSPTWGNAIKAKCWDCSGHQKEEIRHCTMPDCSLFSFRPYK